MNILINKSLLYLIALKGRPGTVPENKIGV